MKETLDSTTLAPIAAALTRANTEWIRAYPGDGGRRQPVHTVYGGAHLFSPETAKKMGGAALKTLREYAPDPASLAKALGMDADLADTVYPRVVRKLEKEAVEDFRIDFEDGYGIRPETEEDGHAETAALAVAEGMKGKSLPPFLGIRVKTPSEELFQRGVRTFDIFLTTLLEKTGGRLPDNFVVTIPKVAVPEQVTAWAQVFSQFEMKALLPAGVLKMELMIETTQSILGRQGTATIPAMVRAADGRVTGAHFGTYDYTAACDVTAAHQHMRHPACDFARHVVKVTLANTGVFLSDGATNIMPIGPHRGAELTAVQKAENTSVVHRAWKLSYDDIRHSLTNAFYQGWDLHPAQLPVRYAAAYGFFLEGMESASQRLRSFMDKAAQATLLGDVFDDAATGQGLLNYFLRGLACGAITEEEATRTGLSVEEIRSRSFLRILNARRSKAI